MLDAEDVNWRTTTMIMHDGAPYFTSSETKQTCEELKIPVFLLAPYGYLMQPIELFFGVLKSSNLNPEGHPTTKK